MNIKFYLPIIILLTINNISFAQKKVPVGDNELSKKEKEDGWMLLFDGKSLKGWHNYNSKTLGERWVVEDDAIHLKVEGKSDENDREDLVTDDKFQDFELIMEWKIAACGNSGVLYNVVENKKFDYAWETGLEYQLLDSTCHPEGKIMKHKSGDLFELIAAYKDVSKPAGQWNKLKIKVKENRVQHWLNGEKVVDFTIGNKKYEELIKNSKYKDLAEAYGLATKGYIVLQDAGDKVWFKNIKIRKVR